MLGRCHQPGPHGVIVQIFQLLEHHFVPSDGLRMKSLLPDLMSAEFVFGLVKCELIQQPIALCFCKLLKDAAGGEFFDIRDHAAEVRC